MADVETTKSERNVDARMQWLVPLVWALIVGLAILYARFAIVENTVREANLPQMRETMIEIRQDVKYIREIAEERGKRK